MLDTYSFFIFISTHLPKTCHNKNLSHVLKTLLKLYANNIQTIFKYFEQEKQLAEKGKLNEFINVKRFMNKNWKDFLKKTWYRIYLITIHLITLLKKRVRVPAAK